MYWILVLVFLDSDDSDRVTTRLGYASVGFFIYSSAFRDFPGIDLRKTPVQSQRGQ